MADMISRCNSSNISEEENEFDESSERKKVGGVMVETYTFVSSKTSGGATTTLLGILDKISVSIILLSKLEVHATTVEESERIEPRSLVLGVCPAVQSCMLACTKVG